METQVTSSDVVDTCAALGKSKGEAVDSETSVRKIQSSKHDSASRRQHESSPQTFLESGGFTELIRRDPGAVNFEELLDFEFWSN